jgi:uncharacterized SAM-binding protein YcdF (DUF218 family)
LFSVLAVKKFITALMLPPGCLILALLAIAVRFARKRDFRGGALIVLPALLLWLGSISPVSDRLMFGLEKVHPLPSHPTGDVILLLGGGINEGVADLSGKSAPSADMLGRIVTAVRLQKELGCPVIVSGGAVFEFSTAEAPIDKRFIVDLGVPADRVILEEKSRDTVENAVYSARIIKERGFRHPILVTSAYHMRRSVIACRKNGLEVLPVPAAFHGSPHKRYGWVHYLPGTSALHQTSTALREYMGLLFYRLTL